MKNSSVKVVIVLWAVVLLPPPAFTQSPPGGSEASACVQPIYGSNTLWLEITGVSNSALNLVLHNTKSDASYQLLSTETLTDTQWVSEGTVTGLENAVSTPASVAMNGRASLFVKVISLTSPGVNTGTNADPNTIQFSVSTTNQYVNVSQVSVQINVSAGVPAYMAALVDSKNYSAAVWQPFSSNMVVNLGSVEGWHSVWVGLEGAAPAAPQTWQWINFKLSFASPVLIVTNSP
jgi:hypothetical protein